MYYEEQVINGVLCFRHTPDGLWIEMGQSQLTDRYTRLRDELKTIRKESYYWEDCYHSLYKHLEEVMNERIN